jgi:hypothetical protein
LLGAASRAVEQLPLPPVTGIASSAKAGKVRAALTLAAPSTSITNPVAVFFIGISILIPGPCLSVTR